MKEKRSIIFFFNLGLSTHFLFIPPSFLVFFAVALCSPLRPSSPMCRPECQEEEAGVGRAPRRRRREGGRATCPHWFGPSPPGLFPTCPPRTSKGAPKHESAWSPSPWRAQVAASEGNSKRRVSVLECFDKRQGSGRGLTCTWLTLCV